MITIINITHYHLIVSPNANLIFRKRKYILYKGNFKLIIIIKIDGLVLLCYDFFKSIRHEDIPR